MKKCRVKIIILGMIFSLFIVFFNSTTSSATEYLLNFSVNSISQVTLTDIYGNQVAVNPNDGVPAVYLFGRDNYGIAHLDGIRAILANADSISCINFYFFGADDNDIFGEEFQYYIEDAGLDAKIYIFPESTEYISFRQEIISLLRKNDIYASTPFAVYKNSDNIMCVYDNFRYLLDKECVLDSIKKIGVQVTFPSTGTVSVSGSIDYVFAHEMIESLNQERANKGLPLVTMDKDMLEYAVKRAAEYSNFYKGGSVSIPTGAYDYMYEDSWKGNGTFFLESYDYWWTSTINTENLLKTWYDYGNSALFDSNVTAIGLGIFIRGDTAYCAYVLSDKTVIAASNNQNCDATFEFRVNSKNEGTVKGMDSFMMNDIQGKSVTINPRDGVPAIYIFGGISSCGQTNATLETLSGILDKTINSDPINIYAFDIKENSIEDIQEYVDEEKINSKIYVFQDSSEFFSLYYRIYDIANSSTMPFVGYKDLNNNLITVTSGVQDYSKLKEVLIDGIESIGVSMLLEQPNSNSNNTPNNNPNNTPNNNPNNTPNINPSDKPNSNPNVEPENTTIIDTVAMHRLYNPNSGEHFYTANVGEKDNLVSVGWSYEGVAWYAPVSGSPVYRLYNANAGDHHYTLSEAERDSLIAVGWKYEGVAWCSGGNIPLYRAYNPNAIAGSHHYTTNEGEIASIVSVGWRDEGVAWYGVR